MEAKLIKFTIKCCSLQREAVYRFALSEMNYKRKRKVERNFEIVDIIQGS